MRIKILFGIFTIILLSILPFHVFALSNTVQGTATGGSTFTLTVTVDDTKVKDGSKYTVMVKLTANSFAADTSDFNYIVLYAKIEGGTYIRTNDSSASLINTVGGETSAVFVFLPQDVPIKELAVSAKAFFRENLAWEFDPETTNAWFNAFALTVKASFPSLIIISLALMSTALIATYALKKK